MRAGLAGVSHLGSRGLLASELPRQAPGSLLSAQRSPCPSSPGAGPVGGATAQAAQGLRGLLLAVPPTVLLPPLQVLQRAVIEVDEEGTEAAAGTLSEIVAYSMPPVIKVNRPFHFLIYEEASRVALFLGRVVNPTLL